MGIAFAVLGLSGVGEAEKFVDFETVRRLPKEGFKLRGGIGVVARFILAGGGLELLVEDFGGRVLRLRQDRGRSRKGAYEEQHETRNHVENFSILLCRDWSGRGRGEVKLLGE